MSAEELQELKKPIKQVSLWLSTLGSSSVVTDHNQMVNSNVTLKKHILLIPPLQKIQTPVIFFLPKEFFGFLMNV